MTAPTLGLRANLAQFSLLVVVNAFVGARVGTERSILSSIAGQEFAAGHIEGAIHIPVADIEADPTRLPLDRPIVTACGKGGGRSEGAAAALAAAGALDVGFLEGGTLGWLADT